MNKKKKNAVFQIVIPCIILFGVLGIWTKIPIFLFIFVVLVLIGICIACSEKKNFPRKEKTTSMSGWYTRN